MGGSRFPGTIPFGKSGLISKEGFNAMKKERGKCRILQKKGGINFNDFHCKVRKAMNGEAYYSLRRNNCIHFALYLLDMAEFYMKLVSTELGVTTGVVGQVLHPQPALPLHPDPIPPGAGPWVVGTAGETAEGTAKPPAHGQLSLAGGNPK